jgi:citrate lyase subunit beta / citryl-CoA lyase
MACSGRRPARRRWATTASGYCTAVNQAFTPSEADYSLAARIIEAYAHATTVQARGAVMLGDEMIDEASRKMAEVIVTRGNAVGLAKTGKVS